MIVKNETNWNTEQLKNIFQLCFNKVKETEKWKFKTLTVKVKNHRRYWVGGYAYYNSNFIAIKMPSLALLEKEKVKWDCNYTGFDLSRKVADTFLHEIGHCLGIHHHNKDAGERLYQDWIKQNISVETHPLSVIANEPPIDKAIILKRKYDTATQNLKKAATRMKRAETIYKKWDRRVRHYGKLLK